MPNLVSLLALFITTGLLFRLRSWAVRRKANPMGLPYPPGPRAYPLIGNIFDLPESYPWLKYAKWGKKYGDIVHIEALGRHLIILNSREVCADLLEKRSAVCSDKPHSIMLCEIMNFSWFTSLLPYGPVWRQHRKIYQQYFHNNIAARHVPKQLVETRKTLLRLLENPEAFRDHIRLSFSATILSVVYGIEVAELSNQYVQYSEKFMEGSTIARNQRAFLVDFLPILKYVPDWFPGANFKRIGRYYREATSRMINAPVEFVQRELALNSGRVEGCVYADLHQRLENGENIDNLGFDLAKNIAAGAYAAGADTSISSMLLFFLAMSMYPEAQAKAQTQLDEVVGNDRLPEYSDLVNLPYIQAVVKELLQWQPVVPTASPHKMSSDEMFRGYYIPKDSIIIGNSWAILHDESAYPEPFSFRPERFLKADGSLNPEVLDPSIAIFGYGRRICPGRFFANNGLLIMAASVLSVFNVRPRANSECDATRNDELNLSEKLMTSGAVSYPRQFECRIEPRSPDAVELIRKCAGA